MATSKNAKTPIAPPASSESGAPVEGLTPAGVATPLPTVDQAKAELDANPGRTSVLSDQGHVVPG